MATRKVYLTVESGGYITNGKGEWVDFYVTSGGEAFGAYEPYAIEIDFSGVTSWHSGNVTHDWKIEISSDGEYGELGDNYTTIGTFSKIMNRSNANFDLDYTLLTSTAISNLKSNGITNIGIFQDNEKRRIEGYSYASAVATIYYNEPSYDWNYGPSNVQVSQNNDGTFNASWDAASWQGPGSIWYYMTSSVATGVSWIWNGGTTTANNVSIPAYDSQITITITAEEQDSWSGRQTSTTYTFKAPTLSAPSISLSATTGQSVTITRGDSTVNKGSATSITYDLYRGSSKVGTFSGKTYSINQSTLESWKQTTITFKVKATASGVKPVVNNKSTLTAESSTITFTFEPYKTILYYTGNGSINGYEECIVYYYTGNPNEGNNGWVECEPYIYTGESNATINGWQLCSYI